MSQGVGHKLTDTDLLGAALFWCGILDIFFTSGPDKAMRKTNDLLIELSITHIL